MCLWVLSALLLGVVLVSAAFSQQVGPFVKYKDNPILEPPLGMARAWAIDFCRDGSYAYVPGRGLNAPAVWIIDLSDLANPQIIKSFDIPCTPGITPEAWDLQVVDTLLYVAAFKLGLWIYDIEDPINPVQVGHHTDLAIESRGLWVAGNYCYVSDAWHGLAIYDVSNPFNPLKLSLYNTDRDISTKKAEFHDVKVVNDTAYCAAGDHGLVIVDVTDRTNPRGISFCCDCVRQSRYPAGRYDWGRGIDVDIARHLAFLGDNRTGLRIVDVTDPANPAEIGYYERTSPEIGELWRFKIVGDRAYIPYEKEFIVLNISDPTSPAVLSTTPLAGKSRALDIRDVYAYVVEESSLLIYDVSNPSSPALVSQSGGFESKGVYNPAAIVHNDTLYLLYRAEDANSTSRIGLAKSTDGIHFTRRSEPVVSPEHDYEIPRGCEDPRIVKVEDTYYMTYTAFDGHLARLALATSKDLIHWDKYGPILHSWGWSKSGAVVAEEINGQYIMYFGDGNMWIAYSQDLIHWTADPNPVMKPRSGYFDSKIVEPGPPPVITEEGLLLIYNGSDGQRFSTGWVLFSKNDPKRILARAAVPILKPEEDWEKSGTASNVVFSEGLVNYKGAWYLYYGGADTRIGVATCEGQIISEIKKSYKHEQPMEYNLAQNYPNPFNNGTAISFTLLDSGETSLKVYSINGQEVATLINSNMAAGEHFINWTARDLSSGVYICKLSVNGFKNTNKMLLVK